MTTTNLAGLWYSRVAKRSQPPTAIETMSSLDLPKLHPRTVIRVPPDEGPALGEIPVISGALLEDNTWPSVGARRGLKRGNGCNCFELGDGEDSGDSFEVEPAYFKGRLPSSSSGGFKVEEV